MWKSVIKYDKTEFYVKKMIKKIQERWPRIIKQFYSAFVEDKDEGRVLADFFYENILNIFQGEDMKETVDAIFN